jgi:hypothetical protein
MDSSFCAVVAAQGPEDLISTAYYCPIYVLIECPPPWTGDFLDSPGLPGVLRDAIVQLRQVLPKAKVLLINRDRPSHAQSFSVLIYQHQVLSNRYHLREFTTPRLADSAQVLLDYCQRDQSVFEVPTGDEQDVLICTHGSHDACCARFGNPFYRQAKRSSKLGRMAVRLWRSSHFGGHRFAPTAVTFPDGRYYGWLTVGHLEGIVGRSGKLTPYAEAYRGWSLLPPALQVMEKQLIQQVGWDWFNSEVDYQILTDCETKITAQMSRTDRHGVVHYYRGSLTPQLVKAQVSCHQEETSAITKYELRSLFHFSPRFVHSKSGTSPRPSPW